MAPASHLDVKPVRLRLSRKRGFRLQAVSLKTNGLAAVNVARPSRWGNPFRLLASGRERAIARYEDDLRKQLSDQLGAALQPLRGKNLACWCPPDLPCHADVLLRLANAPIAGHQTNSGKD